MAQTSTERVKRWRTANPEKAKEIDRRHPSTERVKRWRAANPEKAKAISRQQEARRQARRRLELKTGTCGICGAAPTATRALARDHDHATGKPRGPLCTRCNMGLGYFKDDIDRLRAAISYLESW